MSMTSVPRRLGRWLVRYRVAVFLVLALALLDRLIAAHADLWRRYDPVFYRDRLTTCRSQRWDLVVLGGSPALCGIDVDRLAGLTFRGEKLDTAFNLGLPLATTAEVAYAVEQGLPVSPRLLVYGIAPTDLNGSRFEPQGARHLIATRHLPGVLWERPRHAGYLSLHHAKERLSQCWPLLHYSEGIRLWAAEQSAELWPGLCPDAVALARANQQTAAILRTPRGVTPTGCVAPESRYSHRKSSGQPLPLFPFLKNYDPCGYLPFLHRLLDEAERHHTPLVLVSLPFCADVEERDHTAEMATYRAVLAEVERQRGVTILWPTRAELGLTDADFADQAHLNADGVTRLTTWLRRALEGL
jgi:hypothetical protein